MKLSVCCSSQPPFSLILSTSALSIDLVFQIDKLSSIIKSARLKLPGDEGGPEIFY